MLDQAVLDFDRADPDAADLEHVVAAPGVPEEAVGVLPVSVAGPDPAPLDRVAGLVVLVPVAGARGVAPHEQVADVADVDRLSGVVASRASYPGTTLARSSQGESRLADWT